MPGNFDSPLKIGTDGCVSPRGPLGLEKDETPSRLDVWIFQKHSDGTDTACMAFQDTFKKGSKWTTNEHPVHQGAKFKPGSATGMALLVSKKGGKTIVIQWTENIQLE
jgi:hypothetical protein